MNNAAIRILAAVLSVCTTLLLLDSVASLGLPAANSAGEADSTVTLASVTPSASHSR